MNVDAITAPIGNGVVALDGADAAAVPVSGSTVMVEGLSKSFGGVVAVDDVSLDVAAGEFVSLLGPSGSGKTTILMMLAGFESPTAGLIRIADRNVTSVPPYTRDIGMVFQSYALFPHMTVFENIAYPLKLRKMGKSEIERRVRAALDIVRLPVDQYANRYPSQLSGGQRQRVALVRALVYEPRILLMDEPMGALDKNLRDELKLELISLQSRLQLTIIYVTHDQEEALMLSDRVAVMRDGRIDQIDHPQILYKRPRTEFVANFLGEANLLTVDRKAETEFVFSNGVACTVPEGRYLNDCDHWLCMIRPEEINLVDEVQATLIGRVVNAVFLGGSIRAEIETPIGLLTVVANSGRADQVRPGERVGLRFDTIDPVLIPGSADTR